MIDIVTLRNLEAGTTDHILVGQVPLLCSRLLGWTTNLVHLSRYSLDHIRKRHPDLSLEELLWLPQALSNGLIFRDKKDSRIVNVCFQPQDCLTRYRVVLKYVPSAAETYVSTMHRMRARQTRTMLRRGEIIYTHKINSLPAGSTGRLFARRRRGLPKNPT